MTERIDFDARHACKRESCFGKVETRPIGSTARFCESSVHSHGSRRIRSWLSRDLFAVDYWPEASLRSTPLRAVICLLSANESIVSMTIRRTLLSCGIVFVRLLLSRAVLHIAGAETGHVPDCMLSSPHRSELQCIRPTMCLPITRSRRVYCGQSMLAEHCRLVYTFPRYYFIEWN